MFGCPGGHSTCTISIQLVIPGFSKAGQIVFPLHGQQLLFIVVARFTAGCQVPFCAFPSAGDRYNMIHGQFFRGDLTTAIGANPFGTSPFPPLRMPQIPGLVTLPADIGIVEIESIWFHTFISGQRSRWSRHEKAGHNATDMRSKDTQPFVSNRICAAPVYRCSSFFRRAQTVSDTPGPRSVFRYFFVQPLRSVSIWNRCAR